jgi:hypothetical protein
MHASWISKDQVSDYEYRVKLPALASSFTQDSQIRQAETELAQFKSELEDIKKRICPGVFFQRAKKW